MTDRQTGVDSAVDDPQQHAFLAQDERRTYPRVAVDLPARCLMPDGGEYETSVRDVSASGCFIALDPFCTRPTLGDKVVTYIEQLGRFEGIVVRSVDDGFALDLSMTPAKRDRFAVTLEKFAQGDTSALEEIRRHPRVEIDDKPSLLKLANGQSANCRIIDMSLSGASVETHLRPTIGAFVELGRMQAKVVRYHENGFAVEFSEVAPTPKAVLRHFDPIQ
jgi:hypothetical protein